MIWRYVPVMTLVKRIYTLLSIMGLLVTVLAVPAVNAAASHACCPPDAMGTFMTMTHVMDDSAPVDDDSNTPPTGMACDFSCCGIVSGIAVSEDFTADIITWQSDTRLRLPLYVDVQSVVQGIVTPPPKLVLIA